MLGLLRDIHLHWRIRSRMSEKRNMPLSWDDIQRVALIVSNKVPLSKNEVDRFIESTGKYVEVIYIEKDTSKPSFADWTCLTRERINFLGLPKDRILDELSGKKFDLVINATPGADRVAAMISAAMNARMRCSASSKHREADLIITATTTGTMGEYLTEVLRYLQMIRARRL